MINLTPIIESLVAGAVAVVFGSLWFADRVLKREAAEDAKDPRSMRAAIAEKRRVLERQRENCFVKGNADDNNARTVMSIDEQLLELASEESTIPLDDGDMVIARHS